MIAAAEIVGAVLDHAGGLPEQAARDDGADRAAVGLALLSALRSWWTWEAAKWVARRERSPEVSSA